MLRFFVINEAATVEEAARLMAQKKVKTLPVMDNEKLVGVLTFTDIVFEVPKMLSVLESLCKNPPIILFSTKNAIL